jgi:hypothetical protein
MENLVEREISERTMVSRRKGENRNTYLQRLTEGVNELSDDDFNTLSNDAQEWANLACTEYSAGQPITDFNKEVIKGNVGNEFPSTKISEKLNVSDLVEDEGSEIKESEVITELNPVVKVNYPETRNKEKKTRTSSGNGKDRYGLRVGSKTSRAVELYEQGVKMCVVREELGCNYYNVLNKLSQQGHIIEHLDGGIIKIRHKED